MAGRRQQNFNFEISLSVLNHLGRNLYRNFITVLGEAISNSWDADAKNVFIEIDRENSTFSIKDDGVGMNSNDFQTKFLQIGYTKRAKGKMRTPKRRPFIGAKGIGKLALLSCADRITVFSKKKGQAYIGGTIDNSGLNEAIKDNLRPEQYPLETPDRNLIRELSRDHNHGTIIVFEGAKDQIRNSIAHIKKLLALYFRFSLLDKNFSIHVDGEKVTRDDLNDLTDATQFLWVINNYADDFVDALDNLKSKPITLTTSLNIKGFLATVEKPSHIKISGTNERATIDLFVNGRLREKNILRRIPTQRVVESYIYGQVHFDSMDAKGKDDPFTSSREGVKESDKDLQNLLEYLPSTLQRVFDRWDKLRLKIGKEGDDENPRKTKRQRRARDLYSLASDDYSPKEGSDRKDVVDGWLTQLQDDAEFNIDSYVDCFLSENLTRRYIEEQNVSLGDPTKVEARKWRKTEDEKKNKANLSYAIRKNDAEIDYLGMDYLAFSVEGRTGNSNEKSLTRDAIEYAPVRNVVGHTGLLTDSGKNLLSLKYENIKARIRALVGEGKTAKKKTAKRKATKKKTVKKRR